MTKNNKDYKKILSEMKKFNLDLKKFTAGIDKKIAKIDQEYFKFLVKEDVEKMKTAKAILSEK